MLHYACNFVLEKDSTNEYVQHRVHDLEFVSFPLELYDWIYFESDFDFEDGRIRELENGAYYIYAQGTAEFELDRDWESGIEEGHYLLGLDVLKIMPFPEYYERKNETV